MSREDLIERVRKLLALSTSSNVHEAAAAAAKAQRLMTQHQIAEAELAIEAGTSVLELTIEQEWFEKGERSIAWRQMLAHALAEANGAKVWAARKQNKVDAHRYTILQIVGTRQAIDTVLYMHTYLATEVNRLCIEERKHLTNPSRTYAGQFRIGAAVELSRRITQAAADARRQAETEGHGAALARLDDVAERIQQLLPPSLRKSKAPRLSDVQAFRAGAHAARQVALEPGRQLKDKTC